ncbi:MAG: hypothetical protein ACR2NB_06400 [Solirubrobacteraceae bacterium]
MPARQRLTDEQVEELRVRFGAGGSKAALGRAFGVSRQHVARLVEQSARPRIAGLDAQAVSMSVARAVDDLLGGPGRLSREGAVLAAAIRVVAGKLDECAASETGAAAGAIPRLAGELVGLLDALEHGTDRAPDFIDDLRQRRDVRLLASVAASRDAL